MKGSVKLRQRVALRHEAPSKMEKKMRKALNVEISELLPLLIIGLLILFLLLSGIYAV